MSRGTKGRALIEKLVSSPDGIVKPPEPVPVPGDARVTHKADVIDKLQRAPEAIPEAAGTPEEKPDPEQGKNRAAQQVLDRLMDREQNEGDDA